MSTDAKRRANAAYLARKAEEGLRAVTVRLGPEARGKLDALKASCGSKDKAVALALMAYQDGAAAAQEKFRKAPRSKAKPAEKTDAPPKVSLDLPVGPQPFTPRLKKR